MKISVLKSDNTVLTLDTKKILTISDINQREQYFTIKIDTGYTYNIKSMYYNYVIEAFNSSSESDDSSQTRSRDGFSVVNSNERDLTLEPNKYYIFGECATLNIAIGEVTTNNILNEYIFEFTSGATPTVLTLPSSVTPIENLSPNTKYVISIKNNVVTKIENPSREVENVLRDLLNKMLTKIVIPEGVTVIPQYFFYNHIRLTEVVLPSTLTKIEMYAFYNCNALVSINLPNNLTIIDRDAFMNCSNIESISFPSALTTIGIEAFRNCTVTQFSQLPSNLTTLGGSAFNACKGITSITVPEGITSLEGSVFGGCTGLRSVSLPNTITSIAQQAFDGCTSLVDIEMYDSVTTLTDSITFRNIDANCKVRIYGTNRVIPFLLGAPATVSFYVDPTMVQSYKSNSAWSARAAYIFSLEDY